MAAGESCRLVTLSTCSTIKKSYKLGEERAREQILSPTKWVYIEKGV